MLQRRRSLIEASSISPITPSDYVQDGLIHMWDGEINDGVGHSTTLSTWKDLVGNIDLTVSENAIIGDKYIGNDTVQGYIASYSSRISCKTMQIVFKRNSFDTSRTTFVLSNRQADTRVNGNFHFNYGNLGYLYFESLATISNRRGVPMPLNDMNIHTVSASWSSNSSGASLGYDNTCYTMVSSLSGTGRNGATNFLIGSNENGGTYTLLGNIYCVRLYDRVLTAEEIIKNQKIDLIRFNGKLYDAEVEYLRSNSGRYIDTGIVPDINTQVNLTVKCDSYVASSGVCATRLGTATANRFYPLVNNSSTQVRFNLGNGQLVKDITYGSDILDIKFNDENHSVVVNGETLGTFTDTGFTVSTNNSLYLFGTNGFTDNRYYSKTTLFDCSIIKSGTKVADLVPVRIGSIGYLYDKVRDVLLGCRTSNAFEIGPDKGSGVVFVKSIRESGARTGYIRTGFAPPDDCSYCVGAGAERTQSGIGGYIFGVFGTNDDVAYTSFFIGGASTTTWRQAVVRYDTSSNLAVKGEWLQRTYQTYNLFVTPKRYGVGDSTSGTYTKGSEYPYPNVELILGKSPAATTANGFDGIYRTFYVFGSDAQNETTHANILANHTPIATFQPCIYNGVATMWHVEERRPCTVVDGYFEVYEQ